jgi:RNA polymerase sigma-70 factor (ECF subfamily)
LTPELQQEFEARFAESARLAFRVAYGVLRQREDAEDVAQEAMAKAYRELPSLRNPDAFRSWLVRMTWRMSLDRRRAEKRRGRREETAAVERVVSIEDMAISRSVEAHVWRAIDALPEHLRSVVILGAMNGHDVRQVAMLLEVPEGTVKSRLHRARKTLAEMLRWILKKS